MENEIYKYLLENALGFENRIKGQELMKIFNISDHKTLRSYIEEARNNAKYEYLIGSEAGKDGGYYIPISLEEKDVSTSHIRLRAESQLRTYENMEGKRFYEIKESI